MNRVILGGGGPTIQGQASPQRWWQHFINHWDNDMSELVGIVASESRLLEGFREDLLISPPFSPHPTAPEISLDKNEVISVPDAGLMRRLEEVYFTFIYLADRMSVTRDLLPQQRRKLFYQMISWAEAEIKKRKPTHIVYQATPHFAQDYLFMRVAEAMGVKTWSFEFVAVYHRTRLIDFSKKFGRDIHPIDTLVAPSQPDLTERTNLEFEKYVEGTNQPPRAEQRNTRQSSITLVDTIKLVRATGMMILGAIGAGFKIKYGSRPHYWQDTATRLYWKYTGWKARKRYESIATKEPPKEKFILLAMHDAPERVVVPESRPFYDSDSLMAFCAEAAKMANMKLVVREHPAILKNWRRYPRRPLKAYKSALKRHDNIIFGSLSSNATYWSQHAVAVVTGMGTIGGEELLKGKPAFVYGFPWFLHKGLGVGFAGKEELANLISNTQDLDVEEVKAKMLEVFQYTSPCYNEDAVIDIHQGLKTGDWTDENDISNVKLLIELIEDGLRNYQG